MNLVIVESPAKGKTIERYLGKDYKVLASFGHVRDLPRKGLGVDIKNSFKPEYTNIPRARKTISLLQNEAKRAKSVILATDFDREGEAIAWHLSHVIKAKNKLKRITFTEITQSAIEAAIKKPRSIDTNLVESQQARRILDRLVGYKLSPLLWKKVAFGLSAGRVQSVAVRIIVIREKEIEKFTKQEFWKIIALLEKDSKEFKAYLVAKDGKAIEKLSIKTEADPSRVGFALRTEADPSRVGFALRTEADAKKVLDDLKNAKYAIKNVTKEESRRYPSPPFITSTLQQEAFYRLGYTAKKTMFLAQQLYEAGMISYHRTDSTTLSTYALSSIKKYIKEKIGEKYLPEKEHFYKTKVLKAQEAHEAIRPTHFEREKLEEKFSGQPQKLYDLIWRRTIACQMKEAILEIEKAEIAAKNYLFAAQGQAVIFDGFSKIYPVDLKDNVLPKLEKGDKVDLKNLQKEQNFTNPPSRYTEATLIKALEKEGIGRPSTYAPILSTIQSRSYIDRAKQYLFPTEMGRVVNDLLEKNFSNIVDLQFTAKMEENLDKIAEGDETYLKLISDFYKPFSQNLKEKDKELKKSEITEEATKERCQKCHGKMKIKLGRYGKFLACENYPKCKNTKPYLETTGKKCKKCKKGELVERKNKRGQLFLGCSRFPKCDHTEDIKK